MINSKEVMNIICFNVTDKNSNEVINMIVNNCGMRWWKFLIFERSIKVINRNHIATLR